MLDKPTKLYVGSLPYDVDDSALREIFSKYGEITEVSIVQEEDTGKSKGFGFVTFKDQESADAAIDGLNETSLGHRHIMVQYAAKPGTDRQPATRGGRGGYRGARGGQGRGYSGRGGYGGGN